MAEVAVIIPVYNAERTLERTMDSVLRQTFRNLELVVVDDGSTDGSHEVACRVAERDSRVRVIRQANSRCYAARVAGIRDSTSRYVAFVDADDTVRPALYGKLVAAAKEHDLDVVQCEQTASSASGGLELFHNREEVREKFVRPLLLEGRDACFVWDKLYDRRCFPKEFEQSTILMGEDLKFNLQVFVAVERMGILHEGLYDYDVNAGSSVRNFHPQSVSDLREQIGTRARWLPRYGFAPDDPAMYAWILKNVRIYLSRAACAPVSDSRIRRQNVRSLLSIPELQEARSRVPWGQDRNALFVMCAARLPASVFIVLMRLLKRIQMRLRGGR